MIKLRLKSLKLKFSYGGLITECPKQGWRLPTLEEAKTLKTDLNEFWVQNQTDISDDRLYTTYNVKENKVYLVNKKFMIPTAVIVEPETCSRCEHLKAGCCRVYSFYPIHAVGVPASEFGCTTSFKRRLKVP